jgi:hypothetical protein
MLYKTILKDLITKEQNCLLSTILQIMWFNEQEQNIKFTAVGILKYLPKFYRW